MKSKPQKPQNPIKTKTLEFDEGVNLQTLINSLPEGVTANEVWLEFDYATCNLCYRENKYSSEQWEKELEKYNKRLFDYQVWHRDNEDEINAKLEERRQAALKKEKKRLEKLLRDTEKLEKQIEKLSK